MCLRSSWSTFSIVGIVINMSSQRLTKIETIVLGLGLPFALPPASGSATIDAVAALDTFIYKNRIFFNNPNLLRGAIIPYFVLCQRNHLCFLNALTLLCVLSNVTRNFS